MEKFKEPYKDRLYNFEDERVELPETFKIISCPNCATKVPVDHLIIEDRIGKCGSCQAIFSIEKDIQGLQNSPQKIKQEILRPEGIELFYFQDELEITFEQPMSWLEWPVLILFAFLCIPGFVISIEEARVLPFLFLVVVPSIIGFLYYLRRKAKHRVILTIDDRFLNIMWRPKKLHVDQHHEINDIQQVYVKHRPDIGGWYVYMIIDSGNGQKHVKLTSLKSASKAKYLEQEIESRLKIQDVIVPEES